MKKLRKKGLLSILLILMLLLGLVTGCTQDNSAQTDTKEKGAEESAQEKETQSEEKDKEIILSTTTSTQDSGLLDEILPDFTEKTGIKVKVVAVGTGQALRNGEDGEADVLLVHAKKDEEKFVEEGHGLERFDVMYNDFVILGPKEDPAGIKENPSDVIAALKKISESQATFVSRADDSGTHKKELALWQQAGIEPSGDWYKEAGQGMGDTIQMAEEMQGYTLSDRATYLSMKEDLDLEILVEGDEGLFNQYGVIAVNPEKNDQINGEGAQAFVNWILSDETQKLIGEYGKEEYGEPLFTPNAK